jgi:hypothetical protein
MLGHTVKKMRCRSPIFRTYSPLWDRAGRLRLPLYADDAAVFVNPVKADIDMIMAILHNFGRQRVYE